MILRTFHLGSTASETNNDCFTIEKSTDGKTFEPLGTVLGHGNSTSTIYYEFKDLCRVGEVNYYRLSQTDFDGTTQELGIQSSHCKGKLEITIHPNPTESGVYISPHGKLDNDLQIQIYNSLGGLVSTHFIKGSTYILLPEQKGIYLFHYVIVGKKKVKKVVKY
ncbi:T9SS type A sorting domain-containing protein [Brumimicrobium salinarum]|uniref:T9SS type A sorting domain-containing protein n=1 Tax=Brumimicrobium salinarum TaxID=2058658 RepID=UPI0013FE43F9|nr:T9SS type A sorting domain-containing protein [Brumimicrobium salinarum]